MRALLKILTRESLVSFVALIVLLLLVWFGGEFLHAKYGIFERTTRILVMAVVLAVWFLLYIVQKVFAIRGAMQIEKRLRAQAADQRESVRPDKKPEVEALEKQLTEAIQALKASTFGKEALYALPWYIIVGPPGVGKTTALVESGLSFPHMSQGRRGIRGVGGTRNCDWWFTDQGILLDTAGRYTTELEDRDEWLAFLEMLRKSRKWKPINGAIVAVSVPELLRMTAEDLANHAKNIRDRIDELTRSLELVFPVYLIFTKCDLLSGFTEFFEGLSKADRAQAWGATLPYGIPSDIGAVFEEEVKKLYAALCARRVKALSADLPHEKRRQIYSFPIQFAVAERRLQEFTAELFRSNPYQESSILRGFYFTSGTQEGAPIDQVVAAMGQAFGLKEEAGSFAKQVTEKKSYFLHDLFTKIIFPDQNLARSSTRVQKRTRLIGRGIAVGASAAFVIVFILLFLSFSTNYSRISAVSGASTKLKDLSWEGPGSLDSKIEALDELKNGLERIERAETSWIAAPWLFNHGRQVSRAARETLLTRLTSLFAAPCAQILAAELQDGLEKPKSAIGDFESLHGLLRAYLTLSGMNVGLGPLELQETLAGDNRWRRALGEATLSEKEAERSDALLKFYAAQVGRGDLSPVPADKDLVAAVTNDLSGPGWVHAVYQEIVKSPQAGNLLRKMSPDDFQVRENQRGLLVCPEAFQVEGVYTKGGYNQWVRAAVEGQSRALAAKLETVKGAPHDPQPIR
ncbi:MAG TPA: type VI secretion system membrane subunit TssM, partial [Planctomycetota bacterium]|nr:type VI secretion system membrane subunit TssM [Planctomycetota bacterium]